jgi:Glutamine amidotransferases class-II
MCVIVYKPEGKDLPLSTVLRAYQRNDDGWGIVARTPLGLRVQRGFGRDADETLLDAFDTLRAYELVLHCRIATSGRRNLENTHPFEVTPDLFMFHNGVLNVDRSSDPSMCDSFHVAQLLAAALGDCGGSALRDREYLDRLCAYADTSKLVFVDRDGVVIVNENRGIWRDGCWYSNDSALPDVTSEGATTGDDDAFGAPTEADELYGFSGRYFDGVVPRCYRVETPEDEDALYLATVAMIADLEKLDVDEIAERALDDPEMVAEALSLLLQERRTARRAS